MILFITITTESAMEDFSRLNFKYCPIVDSHFLSNLGSKSGLDSGSFAHINLYIMIKFRL